MIVALPAHAKLNLELSVRGSRPDGQHEIATVMQSISLHDLLEAEPAESTSLEVVGAGGRAPAGPDNLVLRAAAALERTAGRPLPARLRLTKRVPSGAGLGGGSSDAAAALRLLSRLHHLDLDLAPLALGLGADVAFFLRGGRALATGRGELLQALAPEEGWFALAWPGIEMPTAAVYAAWDRVGGEGPNMLERAATSLWPGLADFGRRLGGGWRLTGSGSAFFTSCLDGRAARAAAAEAASRLGCWSAAAWSLGPW